MPQRKVERFSSSAGQQRSCEGRCRPALLHTDRASGSSNCFTGPAHPQPARLPDFTRFMRNTLRLQYQAADPSAMLVAKHLDYAACHQKLVSDVFRVEIPAQ